MYCNILILYHFVKKLIAVYQVDCNPLKGLKHRLKNPTFK